MQFSISFVWFVFFGMPVEGFLFMRSNSSQSKRFRFQCFGWSWLGVFCTLCISFNVPIDRKIWFSCSNNTLKTERQKRTTLVKQFFFFLFCAVHGRYIDIGIIDLAITIQPPRIASILKCIRRQYWLKSIVAFPLSMISFHYTFSVRCSFHYVYHWLN